MITYNVRSKALFGPELEVCVIAPCILWVTSSGIVWRQDSPQLMSNFRVVTVSVSPHHTIGFVSFFFLSKARCQLSHLTKQFPFRLINNKIEVWFSQWQFPLRDLCV